MNKKTLSIAIILAVLFGMLIFACDEKNTVSSGDTVSSGETAPSGDSVQNIEEKVPAAAASVVMHGVLERSDSGGLILADGQDRYDLKCDSDLSRLVGRQVKVAGALKTDGSDRFIHVFQAVEDPAYLAK